MSQVDLEIMLIASVVSVSCALPGVFLVLRRMALMSDAISHTVLLGIVLAFFVVQDITSPILVLAAAGAGVLTVFLVEALLGTGLLKKDASIGLVFPALFSIAVILIARFATNVHLDMDAVLLGELAFAPFRRLHVAGLDVGPRGLYLMSGILLLNVLAITLFYKELKLTTFDPALAAALGFSPALFHYGFMSLVSLTAVGAFDAVGSILVVALMIAPPAAAYLLTDRLSRMIVIAGVLGVLAAVAGYWVAHLLDASIAGAMAGVTGLEFLLAFLLAPGRGLIAIARRRARQRVDFAVQMLAVHLLHHEGGPMSERENRESHLHEHLQWSPKFARRTVRRAQRRDYLVREPDGALELTQQGRELARETMVG